MGLHTGECELLGEDIGGIAVHIAGRVLSLAGTREILCFRTVKNLVAGAGFAFADRGTHRLKGVPDTWQLHSVTVASRRSGRDGGVRRPRRLSCRAVRLTAW